MRELERLIAKELEKYFDTKTNGLSIPDSVFDEIGDVIGDLEEDIEELIEKADKRVDYLVEEFEDKHSPSFSEEIYADQCAREAELYSIDNGYYLTR